MLSKIFYPLLNINECSFDLDDCDSNAQCINSVGSYSCECNPGFSFDENEICRDVNECLTPEAEGHLCSYEPEGICTNTVGSYKCSCPQAKFRDFLTLR